MSNFTKDFEKDHQMSFKKGNAEVSVVVDILLSAYNGERYLQEQIDSILNQTYKNWRLIIRDDGSSDATQNIIKSYVSLYPKKIFYFEGAENVGACQSFAHLLDRSKSDYVMFCDQDDVWFLNKIELTLMKMLEIESKWGAQKPILIHTDLKVVDEGLNVICDSLKKQQHLDCNKGVRLNRLLTQNVIVGCTMMVNRALRKNVRFIPGEAIMHDWWLGLVTACFGRIAYLDESTIYYRQHAMNEVGAKSWTCSYLLTRLINLKAYRADFLQTQMQAGALLSVYDKELSSHSKNLLRIYFELGKYGVFRKKYHIFKNKYFKSGLIRNLIMLLM